VRDGDHVEIQVTLPAPSFGRLDLYAASGRRVRSFGPVQLPAGTTSLEWDLRGTRGELVASGLYFVRVRLADETLRAKVLLAH
jgi:hypothetical protein